MFVTVVCVLFLLKLKWPKIKNFYDTIHYLFSVGNYHLLMRINKLFFLKRCSPRSYPVFSLFLLLSDRYRTSFNPAFSLQKDPNKPSPSCLESCDGHNIHLQVAQVQSEVPFRAQQRMETSARRQICKLTFCFKSEIFPNKTSNYTPLKPMFASSIQKCRSIFGPYRLKIDLDCGGQIFERLEASKFSHGWRGFV